MSVFTQSLCMCSRCLRYLAFGKEATQNDNLSDAGKENNDSLTNRPVLDSLIEILSKYSTLGLTQPVMGLVVCNRPEGLMCIGCWWLHLYMVNSKETVNDWQQCITMQISQMFIFICTATWSIMTYQRGLRYLRHTAYRNILQLSLIRYVQGESKKWLWNIMHLVRNFLLVPALKEFSELRHDIVRTDYKAVTFFKVFLSHECHMSKQLEFPPGQRSMKHSFCLHFWLISQSTFRYHLNYI